MRPMSDTPRSLPGISRLQLRRGKQIAIALLQLSLQNEKMLMRKGGYGGSAASAHGEILRPGAVARSATWQIARRTG